MEGEEFVLNLLKIFFMVTSPITFIVGIFLLYDIETYQRIERFLGRSYGVSKKVWLKQLEKNRESLQMFLIKRRRIIGVVCLLNSLAAFFINSLLLKR